MKAIIAIIRAITWGIAAYDIASAGFEFMVVAMHLPAPSSVFGGQCNVWTLNNIENIAFTFAMGVALSAVLLATRRSETTSGELEKLIGPFTPSI